MAFIDDQIARIPDSSVRIVYPEGREPKILQAAARIVAADVGTPILLGSSEEIRSAAAEAGVSLEGMELICPAESTKLDAYAELFSELSELPASVGKLMLKKPLYFGAMMVRAGDGDCMIAGLTIETDEVVAANKLIVGMAKGVQTPSCISIIDSPYFTGSQGGLLALSDTAINIDPTADELADIAISSARTVRALLDWEPRVALLSFSTSGSANHERAKRVAAAVKLANERAPEFHIDGEMQLDAALAPDVAAKKLDRKSAVAGRANVLVFPNLDASNIGIKLLQRVGGIPSSGGMLQGFAKPVCDLSRGATVEHIFRNSVMLIRCARADK